MEDGLIILLFFFIFAIACIFLVNYTKGKSNNKPITNSATSYQSDNRYSEFEEDDIDRSVDEMPDEYLIYDDLFDYDH